MATGYSCPSDPGFCYFDVGNDGCFDGGTDTGPINNDLEAGTYPVGPLIGGSIVCPPAGKKLALAGPAAWTTAAGGDVLLFSKKIISPTPAALTITSGRDVVLSSVLRTHDLTVTASADVHVLGKVIAVATQQLGVPDVTVTAGGNVSVGPRGVFKQGDILLETSSGGDIFLLDKSAIHSKNGPVRIVAGGALTASNFKASGGFVEISGQSVDATGHTKIKTKPGVIDVLATGAVQFERLTAVGKGDFSQLSIEGGTVEIGSPGSGGVVRTSRLSFPADLDIDAVGHVGLDELKARVGRALIDTTGTTVSLTNSSFSLAKNPGVAPPEVEITAGAGSTCDVSETTTTDMTLIVNCDSVVGP